MILWLGPLSNQLCICRWPYPRVERYPRSDVLVRNRPCKKRSMIKFYALRLAKHQKRRIIPEEGSTVQNFALSPMFCFFVTFPPLVVSWSLKQRQKLDQRGWCYLDQKMIRYDNLRVNWFRVVIFEPKNQLDAISSTGGCNVARHVHRITLDGRYCVFWCWKRRKKRQLLTLI